MYLELEKKAKSHFQHSHQTSRVLQVGTRQVKFLPAISSTSQSPGFRQNFAVKSHFCISPLLLMQFLQLTTIHEVVPAALRFLSKAPAEVYCAACLSWPCDIAEYTQTLPWHWHLGCFVASLVQRALGCMAWAISKPSLRHLPPQILYPPGVLST